MKKYKIRISPRAYRDLNEIFEYIALEKLFPQNAKEQTNRKKEKIKTLEIFPQSHQERVEGRYAKKGYRQLLIDNHVAIFRIDEENLFVYIVTIQYQGRDI